MKKTVVVLVGLGVLILSTGKGFCAEASSKTAAKAAAPAAAAKVTAAPADSVADIVKKQAMAKARDEMNSHEWMVYLTPAPDPSGKKVKATVKEDTLVFSGEGKILSKDLQSQGYPESNYTLHVQDDGVAVWETMQVKEGEGLAFFRGELLNSVMKGVLSLQSMKGAKQTFYFSTIKPDIKPEPAAAEPETGKKKTKKR